MRGLLAIFPNLAQSVGNRLKNVFVQRPFLENLANKTLAVPPHFSTAEVRVSPTCPSSDCSYKLTSNNADNDQVSVQRRTARLEERPIGFILLSLQPMEQENRRCGCILGEAIYNVVSQLSAEDQKTLIFNHWLTHLPDRAFIAAGTT